MYLRKTSLLVVCTLVAAPSLGVTKTAVESGAIHDGGDNGNADYYASGNDDAFGEYGVATFQFNSTDFGGTITDIQGVNFILTINDRGFSDGTSVEVFYSPDDFDSTYTGLDYDTASAVNGIDAADFASLTSLGVYNVAQTDTNGGSTETIALTIDAIESSLLNEINTGSDFQLVIGSVNVDDDITYSGVGNTFDPGDPQLQILVPEPGSLALLGLGGLLIARRRRSA